MSGEFLTQDEVDALLTGVPGDAATDAAPQDGVRAYDLTSPERAVRGGMPTLELVNDRLARHLRTALFAFMRRIPEVTTGGVRAVRYEAFVRGLPTPACVHLMHAKPLRGHALFALDPALVSLAVDNLFGGDGRFHKPVEGREFTPTELRIVQRLLHVLAASCNASWQTVHPLEWEHVRSETQPQFVNIASANDIVIVSTFSIRFGGAGGALEICMPYAMLEPIHDLLHGAMPGERTEPDRRWLGLLSAQVQSANVELVATLASANVKLGDLLRFKAGDVVPIGIDATIQAEVDGIPVAQCTYGVSSGHYALRIERMLLRDPPPHSRGKSHA
jgi:flagellar motor switch protein FliM